MLKAPTRAGAEQLLSRWLINAESCDHLEGRIWSQLIQRRRPHILCHRNHSERFTNGFIEGVHTRIKLVKRAGYGFTNRTRYRRKMCLAFIPISQIPHLLR